MSDEVVPSIRKTISIRARAYSLIRSVIEPKPVSGWRALLVTVFLALCVMLGSVLLWLSTAQSSSSRQLIAFAGLFFSGAICALAQLLQKPISGIVSRVGLIALIISFVGVNLASGA